MDETIETLTVGVRADTAAFAQDAAAMQASLQGSLGSGADRAGSLIEASLAKAVKSGQLGFDTLKQTALSALSEIAAQSLCSGLGALFGTGAATGAIVGSGADAATGGAAGGLVSLGGRLVGSLLGLPGRATGGPVSPGRAYVVGERGPEMFVPTSAGSIAPAVTAPVAPAGTSGATRDVRVAISIAAPAGAEPRALARSGRQGAQAVSRALAQADR